MTLCKKDTLWMPNYKQVITLQWLIFQGVPAKYSKLGLEER